ncbi:MAG: hypothetical protein K0S67_36 [Nitrososphaeraceae archaeon]|jgi:hypothetical protein|nr:hypothetical protein [Nitrososphaeraceae archaeon]
MVQKILRIQADTKEELEKSINKELKDSLFVVKGLSVLEGIREMDKIERAYVKSRKYYEAWIVIDDQTENIAGFE